MPRIKAASIALVAIVAVLVAAGNGFANRISTSSEQWRIIYSPLRFRTRLGTEITCNSTFEGSLINSGVLNKISGGQYGFVVGAARGFCNISFLTETLSWPIIYRVYLGMLPTITAVETYITNFRFVWGTISRCLYESNNMFPQPLRWNIERSGQVSSVVFLAAWIPSITAGCEEIEVTGTGAATIRAGTTHLTMTLI